MTGGEDLLHRQQLLCMLLALAAQHDFYEIIFFNYIFSICSSGRIGIGAFFFSSIFHNLILSSPPERTSLGWMGTCPTPRVARAATPLEITSGIFWSETPVASKETYLHSINEIGVQHVLLLAASDISWPSSFKTQSTRLDEQVESGGEQTSSCRDPPLSLWRLGRGPATASTAMRIFYGCCGCTKGNIHFVSAPGRTTGESSSLFDKSSLRCRRPAGVSSWQFKSKRRDCERLSHAAQRL